MGTDEKKLVIELHRLMEYTDKNLLDELRRVAELFPDRPLTTRVFTKHARVSSGTVSHRFGGWSKALISAGLNDRYIDNIGGMGSNPSRHLSNDEIGQALRELAQHLGKNSLTVRDVNEHLPFSSEILKKRWGSSRKAFEAAGINSTRLGRRYTDRECFENLLDVWTHYGRPPTYREMSLPPSKVGASAYTRLFGTWKKALFAFVKLAEEDTVVDACAEDALEETAHKTISKKKTHPTEDQRNIPISLRYKILHRDHFKCVKCGDNPPRNPDCVLHVDHILPWSNGGKTKIENLRTLCSTCNIGRGNRYAD